MGGAGEGKRSHGNDVNTALMLQTLKTLKIKFKNSLPRTLPFPHFNDSNRNFKVRACKSVFHTFFLSGKGKASGSKHPSTNSDTRNTP